MPDPSPADGVRVIGEAGPKPAIMPAHGLDAVRRKPPAPGAGTASAGATRRSCRAVEGPDGRRRSCQYRADSAGHGSVPGPGSAATGRQGDGMMRFPLVTVMLAATFALSACVPTAATRAIRPGRSGRRSVVPAACFCAEPAPMGRSRGSYPTAPLASDEGRPAPSRAGRAKVRAGRARRASRGPAGRARRGPP